MAEYIEREALQNKDFGKDHPTFFDGEDTADWYKKCINEAPAAKVAEVKHGKWDRNHNCSVCGVYKFKGLDADVWADWNIDYCPNCGAKMDLECVKNENIYSY